MSEPDQDLLRRFARDHAQDAFTEIVRRHVNLVYSAALRQVRSPQLAEDVSQSVFCDLARNANKLCAPGGSPVLTAWLYQVTHHTAVDVVRKESRRQLREQIAADMNAMNSESANWNQVEPLLDEAMRNLDDTDRAAILLRYFESKSLREVGRQLGVSDDAAQKRVSRAVERLREFFTKRKVTIGASGLVAVVSANAVQAAPAGLVTTISTAVALTGATVATSTAVAATKTLIMTTLQKAIIGTALAAAIGAGVLEAHRTSQLRKQNESMRQQQTMLAAQMEQLRSENARLSNQVAQARDRKTLTQAQFNELLKLRGQTAQARTAVEEMEQMKKAREQQGKSTPAFFTNAMTQGIAMSEKFKKRDVVNKLGRMSATLHLTPDQEQSISNIMMAHIEWQSQQVLSAMLGKSQADKIPADASPVEDEEDAIKALLTPDQLASYPDFKQTEVASSARNSAEVELTAMNGQMDLTSQQVDKVRAVLYQVNLNEAEDAQNEAAAGRVQAQGHFADTLQTAIDRQKQGLEKKLNALQDILSPEQLKVFEKGQQDMIDMRTSALKMFFPQLTNGVAR